MSKIGLVIRREYFTRIRNKTFLLSTFLLPIVIVLFIAGAVAIAIASKTTHRVAVVDRNNYLRDYLKTDSDIRFDFSAGIDTLNYSQHQCSAVLVVPKITDSSLAVFVLKYKKQMGLQDMEELKSRIRTALADHEIFTRSSLTRVRLDSIRASADNIDVIAVPDTGGDAKASSQGLSYAISYGCGILIYLLTFIYGAMVMRGVMEEKTSRIAEVIVSSVKPFPLMMGKIIGIGAVGITQFLMWILLVIALAFAAQAFIPHDTLAEISKLQQANAMGNAGAVKASEAAQRIYAYRSAFATANWPLILGCFLFYFVGGYLFYASLFAAVGSVVNEDPQEAQSLLLPITMPIIFSFFIMSIAIQDPAGSLAFWASIIPFSAPIVMMSRIPYGVPTTVPWWQLLLSMSLLAGGFLFTTWMAGKIYRTGILLYGKKPTWKTMWKWAFKKY